MAGNTVKEMTTNFRKLDKFEGHDFRRWQKKMHFLLTTLKVVYVLTTLMPELMEDSTMEAIKGDKGIDFKIPLKQWLKRFVFGQLGSHLRIEESLRAQDSDKGKGKEVAGPSVNMAEEGKNKNNKQNKGKKRDFKEHDRTKNAGGRGKGSKDIPITMFRLMQLHGGLILVLQLMFVKIIAGLRHIERWKRIDIYMGDVISHLFYGKEA
ncbi:hypothetical protein Tco_0461314 [Tanacetum coccineum]